jgi:hypothetical protein
VKLCSPRVAPARQPERVARHELVSIRTAGTDHPGELLAAGRQDPLHVALDDPSADAEVPGDVVARQAMAVEDRNLAPALVEPVEDRKRQSSAARSSRLISTSSGGASLGSTV